MRYWELSQQYLQMLVLEDLLDGAAQSHLLLKSQLSELEVSQVFEMTGSQLPEMSLKVALGADAALV
jgi:hypothetical protein